MASFKTHFSNSLSKNPNNGDNPTVKDLADGGRVCFRGEGAHGRSARWYNDNRSRRAPAYNNTEESPSACSVLGNVGRIFRKEGRSPG